MFALYGRNNVMCRDAETSHLGRFQPNAYLALTTTDQFYATDARYSLESLLYHVLGKGGEFSNRPGTGNNDSNYRLGLRIQHGNDRLFHRIRQLRHDLANFVPDFLGFEIGVLFHFEFYDNL